MRFIRRLIDRVFLRISHALSPYEVRPIRPSDFLEKVMRETPCRLQVRVIGPSSIFEFVLDSETGSEMVSVVIFFPEEGNLPPIFRALLQAADERGVVKDPFAVLSTNHGALTEFLGAEPIRAGLTRGAEPYTEFHEA